MLQCSKGELLGSSTDESNSQIGVWDVCNYEMGDVLRWVDLWVACASLLGRVDSWDAREPVAFLP